MIPRRITINFIYLIFKHKNGETNRHMAKNPKVEMGILQQLLRIGCKITTKLSFNRFVIGGWLGSGTYASSDVYILDLEKLNWS
jgi:hypothetical protein